MTRHEGRPADDGFFMPAEWETHSRTWMAWPSKPSCWKTRTALETARALTARVADLLSESEPVVLLARPADASAAAHRCSRRVQVLAAPIDDSWLRDTGPSFLIHRDGRRAGVDWPFNGWGNIQPPHEVDDGVAAWILAHQKLPHYRAPLVLEGGAIHVDGAGTILTTDSVLLNPNRNPGLTADIAAAHLRAHLGGRKVIWLAGALQGDEDTDGHVDLLACFAAPGRVLAAVSADEADADHPLLQENLRRLQNARDAAGRSLDVIPVRQPRRYVTGGQRLPLSYINFYIANDRVLVPAFDDPADENAASCLREQFPGRQILSVPCRDLFIGGGGLHCITQQQP